MEIEKTIKKLTDYCDQKFGNTNTKLTYSNALKMFLSQFPNCYTLKEISDEKILQYLLNIPGRSNRCNHHSAIKLLYKLNGFKNKMRFIPYPDKEDKLPIHVNKEEFVKMFMVCENEKHRAVISLMYDAGLRVSEVCNLKLEDIDRSNKQIHIVQSKGKKDRRVKLSEPLLSILENYISLYNPVIYMFNGQGDAAQYSVRSCQEVVKQLTIKSGIKKPFTPHKMRHGFAMGLLENGTPLSEIGNQMGHESEKTTQIYARINNTIIQKIESPLEQIMKAMNGPILKLTDL